jgi:protein gp37
MGKTSIQWTDFSINPLRARNKATGKVGHFCEKISPGCGHCYASNWNEKRMGTGLPFLPAHRGAIEVFLDESKLQEVLRRKKPTRYFWCDMTDMFFELYPDEWLDRCFATMALTPQHTHQVLTKRPERMLAYLEKAVGRIADTAIAMRRAGGDRGPVVPLPYITPGAAWWPLPNVWLGVSVESPAYLWRVEKLLACPAAIRFLSLEPLLADINLRRIPHSKPGRFIDVYAPCPRVDWVIAGGESGPNARSCNLAWLRSLRDQCAAAGVPFFLKQLGSSPFEETGGSFHHEQPGLKITMAEYQYRADFNLRDSHGGDESEWPADLQNCRAFPEAS